MTTPTGAKANPNARLLTYRKLHTWFGLFAAGFLVVIAATGIYLNHMGFFESVLGTGKHESPHAGPAREKGLTTAELATLPVGLSAALTEATARLGDRAVERIEVRPESGTVVYKIKAVGGPEVVIDARSGHSEVRGQSKPEKAEKGDKSARGEKGQKATAGGKAETKAAPVVVDAPQPEARPARSGVDWGKAIRDLHTGKIGGEAGKLLVDLVAVGIILLTLTGVYMWAVPTLRKRRSARQRAVAQAAANGGVP